MSSCNPPSEASSPALCRDAYQGGSQGRVFETEDQTRPDLHLLYLNRQRILAGRGLCHTRQSGLSQSLFSQLLAKLWTILVLRGHKGQPTQTPQLPAQLCLDSGVKDKRGSHKPQPRPTAQRTGLHGLPHPSFLHKALELTPSGLSATQTMGIPVAQHRSS